LLERKYSVLMNESTDNWKMVDLFEWDFGVTVVGSYCCRYFLSDAKVGRLGEYILY
jgi:hypothetical protein